MEICKIARTNTSEKSLKEDHVSQRRTLSEASRMLLHPDSSPDHLQNAVRQMLTLFARITGLDDRDGAIEKEEDAAAQLASGTAISPRDAARCLLDHKRTAQFVRGMHAAIDTALQRFPGQIIEIVYAGCGPYTTLALPLFTCFTPAQIRFTLIDFHQRSLDSARMLVEQMGYGECVRAYVRADATTYRHPQDVPLHIVLTETMQKALAKEPQFAITANLVPQLCAGGMLVPECITIDFCVGDVVTEFATAFQTGAAVEHAPVRIGRQLLLALSAQSAGALVQAAGCNAEHGEPGLPAVAVSIPALPSQQSYTAMLLTRITVFGDIGLDDYDSGLTYPCLLQDAGPLRGGEVLEFRYRLGANPGFAFRRLG